MFRRRAILNLIKISYTRFQNAYKLVTERITDLVYPFCTSSRPYLSRLEDVGNSLPSSTTPVLNYHLFSSSHFWERFKSNNFKTSSIAVFVPRSFVPKTRLRHPLPLPRQRTLSSQVENSCRFRVWYLSVRFINLRYSKLSPIWDVTNRTEILRSTSKT